MIYQSIEELIGNTPVILYNDIYLKLEMYNPGGSIKDRAALSILKDALTKEIIKPGDTIIEATSGNMGIALALLCQKYSLSCIIVMSKSVNIERIIALNILGAEVILVDGTTEDAINYVKDLNKEHNYFYPNQFINELNKKAHYQTAIEIINDFNNLDYIVCGIGTGGTIMGLSEVLKPHFPNLKIVGVEPSEAPYLTKGLTGKHQLIGIGTTFDLPLLDLKMLDEIICVSTNESKQELLSLLKEGLWLGLSSGAVSVACQKLKNNYPDANILGICADGGIKYLSVLNS